jgi:hypothetical protein
MSDERKGYLESRFGGKTVTLLREAPEPFRAVTKEVRDDGVIILKGILQKSETLNHNKRIYPHGILKREVDNYQRLISERRSYGECVDDKTEIMTQNGWKFLKDVEVGDLVFSMDMNTQELLLEPVLAKTDREHDGKMIHIYNNSGLDMMITENHKMLIFDRDRNPFYILAEDLYKMKDKAVVNKWSVGSSTKVSSFMSLVLSLFGNENINDKNVKIKKEKYFGNVYCVTTQSGNWLARRGNSKPFFTGNCDHPDSVIVSFEKMSHIVTKTWWSRENTNELWGEIELMPTPFGKLIEAVVSRDCTIGVSSRGLGSTQLVNGANVVQDDFMLVCWDIVTEPSTPGAFVFKEGREITLESIEPFFRDRGSFIDYEADRILQNYNKLKNGN